MHDHDLTGAIVLLSSVLQDIEDNPRHTKREAETLWRVSLAIQILEREAERRGLKIELRQSRR